jgi:hypothetical protein
LDYPGNITSCLNSRPFVSRSFIHLKLKLFSIQIEKKRGKLLFQWNNEQEELNSHLYGNMTCGALPWKNIMKKKKKFDYSLMYQKEKSFREEFFDKKQYIASIEFLNL